MMTTDNTKMGFTLIEMLIAIAILAILASVLIASLSGFRRSAALASSREEVITAIVKAREFTLSSRDASAWGVHFDIDQATLFKGDTYSIGAPDNEKFTLNAITEITSVALTGGGDDLIFERLTGDTENDGTVTITTKDGEASQSVTILSTGVIESN